MISVIAYLVTDDTFIFEAYLYISCQSTSINSGLAAAAAAEKAERQNTERQNERQNTERQNTERELERRGRKEEGVRFHSFVRHSSFPALNYSSLEILAST